MTTTHHRVSFSLILSLFISSRLMLLIAFPPENLIFYGDFQHYYNVAAMSSQGYYPYLDYWYEFPPIFAYLNLALYTLAGAQLKNYILLMALVMLIAESGTLYLLYRLAFLLHNRATALQLSWIYTALFIPIFFMLGNFDALTTFFILLALYGLIRNAPRPLILGLGLGTMVKFVPLLLLGAVWRRLGFKQMLFYGATTLGISLLIFGPFALLNPTMTMASLQAQAGKSSYQTVWALLDNNYTTGNFGPLADHFDAAKASEPLHNPATLPTWLTLIPFALLGLYIFTRPQTLPQAQDSVTFAALTFLVFILWSQGWSPQWQTFLIPLILLTFPPPRAVLFIIVLGFINFLEWPILLSRGLNQLLPLTIILRTLILLLLTGELYRRFTTPPHA